MSDKQGQGERMYVIGSRANRFVYSFETESKRIITQQEVDRTLSARPLSGGDELLGLFNPQTERVVPKGAEVWTFEQLEDLLIRAEKDPENKLSVRDLIAQACGKGEK